MLIRRAYRFRIYPTPEQIGRLTMWEKSLRWLWNLAQEQRMMIWGRPRADWQWHCTTEDGKVVLNHPNYLSQQAELTMLRAQDTCLDDVPCSVAQGVLRDLDKAWQRYFKKLAMRPKFKGRRDTVGMLTSTPKFDEEAGTVTFPKLGLIRAVLHRTVLGTAKTCTLTRDVDQWYVSISCEQEVLDPIPREAPVVAIDRGVAVALADSDGLMVPNPRFGEKLQERIVCAQRAAANKKPKPGQPGSRQWRRCLHRVAVLKRKETRQRECWTHKQSKYYAEKYGVIIVEALRINNMTRSATGTVGEPGTNVAAKSGLNRAILDVGWGKFAYQLSYKVEPLGGRVIETPPAYSSQTCAVCGTINKASRRSQSEFVCVACGHTKNADLNASDVLKAQTAIPARDTEKKPKKQLRILKRARKATGVTVNTVIPTVTRPVEGLVPEARR
jgi:putative transposase